MKKVTNDVLAASRRVCISLRFNMTYLYYIKRLIETSCLMILEDIETLFLTFSA